MPKIFNLKYLNELLSRDNATLIGTYSKLDSNILINLTCNCNKEFKKLFRDISYYGGAFCKECTKINKSNKIKKTCLKLYGVDNPSYIEEIKKKKEKTYMAHYGDHPKRIKEVNDKFIKTCQEKYKCDNPGQSEEIKKKIKDTFNEKYDGHPMYNEEVKKKVKDTCFERYGGYPAESEEVKKKAVATNLKKYGCHPSQTPEVMNKIMLTSKSYKKYTMPSGIIRNVQGYEPFALDILLKTYQEEQIITNRYDLPDIKYTYNNKTKRYFPDIWIPHINLIIEVKSQWIYDKHIEINKIKEQYTKDAGYNYELWIFNRNGIKN